MPSDCSSSITMASTMKQTPLTCSGHTRPVVDLAFSNVTPAGYFLISACKDGKPMMRQGATGDWIGTFLGHKGAVWGVALNGDATRAATGSADFNAKLWDAVSGEEVHNFTHQHIVKSVEFSKCGNHLLTGSNEKIMRIYDLEKPDADPVKISGHTSGIRHALFFGEKLLISAAEDKTVRVWDKDSLQEIKKLEFPAVPSCLEVTADGKIVLITHGHRVSFWNTETWEMEKEFVIPSQVNSASLHPSKQMFICGGEDFKMYKYDYESGTELESFKGHFGPIHCVQFSPDGELYASGSEDGTLRLWQTTVGKTYGLWKCVATGENTDTSSTNSSPQIIKSEA